MDEAPTRQPALRVRSPVPDRSRRAHRRRYGDEGKLTRSKLVTRSQGVGMRHQQRQHHEIPPSSCIAPINAATGTPGSTSCQIGPAYSSNLGSSAKITLREFVPTNDSDGLCLRKAAGIAVNMALIKATKIWPLTDNDKRSK